MKKLNTVSLGNDQTGLVKLQNSQSPNYLGASMPLVGAEDVETLVSLGLTGRQARVYLALLRMGNAKVKEIADLSLVNRQEIYRVIDSLQEMGLIQKNITIPTTFAATPLNQVLKILLQQKEREFNTVRQKTKCLAKKLETNLYTATLTKRLCLGTVFESDRGKKFLNAIRNAQYSIEVVTTWMQFKQITGIFEKQLQKAIQEGIIVKIIAEKPPDQPLPQSIGKIQIKESGFQLKSLLNPPTASITIFDNTQAVIAFDNTVDFINGPGLWSNNPTIIALSRAYFNSLWM